MAKKKKKPMKAFIHVWADGIKQNMEGHLTPVVLVRCDEDMKQVFVVAEATISGESKLVFRPNPKNRLPGFGGRVMCWMECMARDVTIKPKIDGKRISLESYIDKVKEGRIEAKQLRAEEPKPHSCT